ncbi:MAG: hypothetical protein PHC50_08285 [Candidatus Cloacimonetes bacterium]|nr:hypothetical protein [Candidatus Cloacimonadota bacterium]
MSFEPKVIKNAKDHKEAKDKIKELLGQDLDYDSKDYQLLQVLAVLVEDYEKKTIDLGVLDPIEAIKLRMREKGLKQRDLVPYIGSPEAVSEVLNRKRNLTFDMMKAFNEILDIPLDVFFNYQEDEIPDSREALESKIPLQELIKKGWITCQGSVRNAKKKTRELLDSFFSNKAHFDFAYSQGGTYKRQLVRKGSNIDEVSLATWIYMVLKIASGVKAPRVYSESLLTDKAIGNLKGFSIEPNGPKLAQEHLLKLGIVLVILPHLKKTHIDGAALKMPDNGTPVIALTLRYDRIDNFWFCLFHELAHIRKHLQDNRIIAENLDVIDYKDDVEIEADSLARSWLIPQEEWEEFYENGDYSPAAVVDFAEKIGIHPAIVAGRIRHQTQNWMILSRMVGHNEVRKLFSDEYYKML